MSVSAPKAIGISASRWLSIAGACALLATGATARASPGATLDQYRPAATSDDVFAISRAKTPGHLQLEARLSFDYANDPLVYESQTGVSNSERIKLVSDQLTTNLAVSLGLWDPLLVYASMPVHLVMEGEALGGQPSATGTGIGDVGVGGRYVFFRAGEDAALAAGLDATFPIGSGNDAGPAVAGDAGVALTPMLIGELQLAMLRFALNLGFRVRKDVKIGSVEIGDELTWGASASMPLVERLLDAHVLAYGTTPSSDIGRREGSPFEALVGLGLRTGDRLHFGLATGLGLSRGYGAPDFRVVANAAFRFQRSASAAREPEPKAEEQAPLQDEKEPEAAQPAAAAPVAAVAAPARDTDHDGVLDAEDTCPIIPGSLERQGCAELLQYSPETGLLAWTSPLHWRARRAVLEPSAKPLVEALSHALMINTELQIRVETHMALQTDAAAALKLSADRARALLSFLQRSGIERGRVTAYGCGVSRPLESNAERTEVYVTEPAPTGASPSTSGCQQVELAGE